MVKAQCLPWVQIVALYICIYFELAIPLLGMYLKYIPVYIYISRSIKEYVQKCYLQYYV